MYYQQLKSESLRLADEIQQLKEELGAYPEGKLAKSTQHSSYVRWYHTNNGVKKYISVKNQAFMSQLATKEYLECLLSDLTHDKQIIDFYLQQYSDYNRATDSLLSAKPMYKSLIASTNLVTSQSIHEKCMDWLSTPFTPNPSHPENLIHQGISGHFLRSKSEAMIDTLLHLSNIPFKYEAPLTLGSLTIYPDFTICHPITGRFIYWEHFGLMDDPTYNKNAAAKVQLYLSNGIYINSQLIITCETKEEPLSSSLVKNLISSFLQSNPTSNLP